MEELERTGGNMAKRPGRCGITERMMGSVGPVRIDPGRSSGKDRSDAFRSRSP
jgi:hypothetical protein